MGLLILLLLLLAGCSRNFDSPYLPSSPDYVGSEWVRDKDGNGVADSVEKYAPGCRDEPADCFAQARLQYRNLAGVEKSDPDIDKPGAILVESISAPDMYMTVEQVKSAEVRLLPENATSRNYELSSQNGSVAIVRPGGIYAAGVGSTLITMRALDGSGKVGQFRVTVSASAAVATRISARDLTLETGSGAVLPDLDIAPPEAAAGGYSLSGGDPAVAVVTEDGKHISPRGAGTAMFRVQAPGNAEVGSAFKVTVEQALIRVDSVSVADMRFSLIRLFEPLTRAPTVAWFPADAVDKGYTMTSTDPKVARIAGALVEAGGVGEATITLVTHDRARKATFKVTVSLLDLCATQCKEEEKED